MPVPTPTGIELHLTLIEYESLLALVRAHPDFNPNIKPIEEKLTAIEERLIAIRKLRNRLEGLELHD